MSPWRTLRLAGSVGATRLAIWHLARLRHDATAELMLRSGRENPYPVYERLRAEGVFARSRTGRLVTTDHAAMQQILRDRSFGVREAGSTYVPQVGRFQPQLEEGWDPSFLVLDPPDHTRLRRLTAPAFTPKRLAGYRGMIERTTHRLLDAAERKGDFDLMSDLATPLPVAVIAELLGLPEVAIPTLAEYGANLGLSLDGIRSVRHAYRLRRTIVELQGLFSDLIERRTADPGEDVVSRIVGALGEDRLTTGELLQLCALLLVAGFETTVNLIGNGTAALIADPEQWAALRADPSLAPRVVEETLRYDSPVQLTERVAHTDVEVSGRTIPIGRRVLLLLGAAGRDPRVFAEPDRFDLACTNSADHLAFSAGAHYCLGAPLARLEGAVMFGALAERFTALRPAPRGRVRRRVSVTLRGFAQFPIRVSSAGSRIRLTSPLSTS